jgi:hypothetical protein
MAKRPALTFAAVKAAKTDSAPPVEPEIEDAAGPPVEPDIEEEAAQVKRGRRPKADGRVYGMTLRISPALRLALRRAADRDTERSKTGAIVSVHDVILKAIKSDLNRRGLRYGTTEET